VKDELEPLDPDGDWTSAAPGAAEPGRSVVQRPAVPRGFMGRHRGVAFGVLAPVVAGLVTWGALGHDRHPKRQATGPATLTPGVVGQRALTLVGDVAHHHDDVVVAQFAPALAQKLDALGVQAYWQRVMSAYGPMRRSGTPTVAGDADMGFEVHIPVDLTRGSVLVQIAYLSSGRITSLYFLPAQGPNPPSLTTAYVESRANTIVHDLASGAEGAVVSKLNPLYGVVVTARRLREGWGTFEAAYGTFVSAGPAAVSLFGPEVVDVPVHWAHATSTLVVEFDWNGEVAALALLRPDAPTTADYLNQLPPTASSAGVALTVCHGLVAGDYSSITERFDPVAAVATTQPQLHSFWEHVVAKLGALRTISPPAILADGPDEIIYEVDLTFARGHAHAQVGVDNNLHVEDVSVLPGPPTRTFGK